VLRAEVFLGPFLFSFCHSACPALSSGERSEESRPEEVLRTRSGRLFCLGSCPPCLPQAGLGVGGSSRLSRAKSREAKSRFTCLRQGPAFPLWQRAKRVPQLSCRRHGFHSNYTVGIARRIPPDFRGATNGLGSTRFSVVRELQGRTQTCVWSPQIRVRTPARLPILNALELIPSPSPPLPAQSSIRSTSSAGSRSLGKALRVIPEPLGM